MLTDAMLMFECRPCGKRFEAVGTLEEWTSSIYGPCRESWAACPECKAPAKEYRPKSSSRESPAEGCENGPCGQGPCADGPCGM